MQLLSIDTVPDMEVVEVFNSINVVTRSKARQVAQHQVPVSSVTPGLD